MESEDNILVEEQTPEEAAAENAAFVQAFNSEVAVHEADIQEEVVRKPRAKKAPKEPTDEPEVTPVVQQAGTFADPAAQPRLFAGLTEEQVSAALARNATIQTTVDKMAGRIGQLMQQIEQLKTAPSVAPATQQALDLKLEKLSAAFPELAEILREDLKSAQGAPVATSNAVTQPSIAQADFDALVSQRVSAAIASQDEKTEVKILTALHPDWPTVIRSPEFAVFRENVLPPGMGKTLMESEDSAFISQKLTEFKKWHAESTKLPSADPEQIPDPTPLPSPQKNRLANAVRPTGAATVVNGIATEEDAFLSGFNAERAKTGY